MKRERKKEIDKKIKQFKVKSEISNYLNLHNLYFETDEIEGIPYITMVFKNCDRCPGHITEGSIYFYEECMEVRVYYSEIGTQMCNKSKNLPNLYRLMNYLNAMSWPCVKDGMDGMLYSSEYLVSPLIKMPWPLQAGTPVKDIRDGSYYVLVEGEADWNRYLERIEEKNWYVDFQIYRRFVIN